MTTIISQGATRLRDVAAFASATAKISIAKNIFAS
jgi:hypothetical protein